MHVEQAAVSTSFPHRGARGSARGRAVARRPASSAWIDFAGPAATRERTQLRRRRATAASTRPSRERQVVVVGATATVAAGPARHLDHRRRADARARDPRQRDPHGARRASRCASAPAGSTCCSWSLLGAAAPLAALRLRSCPRSLIGRRGASSRLLVGAQLAFQRAARSSPSSTRSWPGSRRCCSRAPSTALTVAFEREQARDAFARFVPESVVDQVLAGRRGRAPRRRARRGDGHVQRPARVHALRRDARARARHRVAQPLPDRR